MSFQPLEIRLESAPTQSGMKADPNAEIRLVEEHVSGAENDFLAPRSLTRSLRRPDDARQVNLQYEMLMSQERFAIAFAACEEGRRVTNKELGTILLLMRRKLHRSSPNDQLSLACGESWHVESQRSSQPLANTLASRRGDKRRSPERPRAHPLASRQTTNGSDGSSHLRSRAPTS